MIDFSQYCQWEPVRAIFFSGNVPDALVYYAHFTSFVSAVAYAVWFYIKSKGSTSAKIFATAIVAFCFWNLSDMVLFATDRPEYVMFFWSLLSLFEPLIYAGLFFFFYTYALKKPVSFKALEATFLAFVPILILLGTTYNLQAFDLSDCGRDAIEGWLIKYVYLLDIIFALGIVATAIYAYRKDDGAFRPKVISVAIALLCFMTIFGLGNFIGSYTDLQWRFAQYGLLGLPLFILIILFISTKFKLFVGQTIRPILLVAIMWFTVFSLLFADLNFITRILVMILLILVSFSSYFFVRTVNDDLKKSKEIKWLNSQLNNFNDNLQDKVKEQTRELVSAYEIERKARVELQKISDEKDRFIMITQHELRTPLTALRWGAETMLEGGFGVINQAQNDYFKSAKESANRLIKVVNRMADSVNKNLYSATGVVEKSLFSEVLDQALVALSLYATEKHIKIEKNIHIDTNIPLQISQEKLYHVISNLVDNSLKYTPVGGTISISFYSDDEKTVTMKVADNGIGIPAESTRFIFSKFYRATNAISSHPDGSGLGLCIVKSLVEQTGGTVKVESGGEGKGTTVIVVFPRA